MARPYSNDLRERAAALVMTGRSCREVATLFDVSVASVVKWSQRQRATGSAAAKPMGGHRKRLLEPHRALVIERLTAVPDLTLKALVAELAERGIATCPVSVWRLVLVVLGLGCWFCPLILRKRPALASMILAFVLVFAGELIGRAIFYGLHMTVGMAVGG